MLTMFFGCCGTRFAQTSSHLIQKTSTILLIFIPRTNEQPYDFMKKWALFGIILFLSDSNNIKCHLLFSAVGGCSRNV